MGNEEYIAIPEQFEMPSDFGYLAAHKKLTDTFKEKVGRPDANANAGYAGRDSEAHKDELFEQACEDTAREILLNESNISRVAVSAVREVINEKYARFLANPSLAGVSRGSAIH